MGDQLFLLFTPNHSISRKTNGGGATIDLHKVNHREGTTWNQRLDELIGHDVHSDFSKVVPAVWMGDHVLVPNQLFDVKNLDGLYQLEKSSQNSSLSSANKLQHETMRAVPYEVIYNVPNELDALISTRFPNTTIESGFNHAAAHWKQKNPDVQRVFVHLFEKTFCLTCFEEGEMQYQSHFQYSGAEDILYYTLAAAKQYDYNLSETPVYLTGHIEEEGMIMQLLRKYLHNVHVPSIPKTESPGNVLKSPQEYYHIFSLQ